MNHLLNISTLKNRYFTLRHGESEGNVAGIIVSDPKIGVPKYGLTENGRAQVRISTRRAVLSGLIHRTTLIVTSDFARARNSAEVASKLLGTEPIIATELRERFFGELEGTSNAHYEDVWYDDATNPDHTIRNVESANSVQDRATGLILKLEQKCGGLSFLLVSHGDALQILQTGFQKVSASLHRQLPHLETAEIRELTLAPPTAGLPTPSSL